MTSRTVQQNVSVRRPRPPRQKEAPALPSRREADVVDRTIQRQPTAEQFGAFQAAFDYFNERLFENRLPGCILNLSRTRGALGFFSPERWEKDGRKAHEISLNPDWLNSDPAEVMSTLVHEMVHLWQQEYGNPGRRGYHNLEWAAKMEEVGLVPSSTGRPDGKRIGDSMSDYIDPDGAFQQVFAELPDAALLPWHSTEQCISEGPAGLAGPKDDEQTKKRKVKYSCPQCSTNVWGKPGLKLLCGEHERPVGLSEVG